MKYDYEIEWHFEHIPWFMRGLMKFLFNRNLDKAVDVFSNEINWANDMWEYVESSHCLDIGYTAYIAKVINFSMVTFNHTVNPICKYKVDSDNANIVGYCPFIKGSKIWYRFPGNGGSPIFPDALAFEVVDEMVKSITRK